MTPFCEPLEKTSSVNTALVPQRSIPIKPPTRLDQVLLSVIDQQRCVAKPIVQAVSVARPCAHLERFGEPSFAPQHHPHPCVRRSLPPLFICSHRTAPFHAPSRPVRHPVHIPGLSRLIACRVTPDPHGFRSAGSMAPGIELCPEWAPALGFGGAMIALVMACVGSAYGDRLTGSDASERLDLGKDSTWGACGWDRLSGACGT